jgi:hypothetical protein
MMMVVSSLSLVFVLRTVVLIVTTTTTTTTVIGFAIPPVRHAVLDVPVGGGSLYRSSSSSSCLSSMPTQDPPSTLTEDNDDDELLYDPDAPAGIVGAEFFGGSKQKEEFYDPIAEANVGMLEKKNKGTNGDSDDDDEVQFYHRFFLKQQSSAAAAAEDDEETPTDAFETAFVASIGQSLQRQIQRILYDDDASSRNEKKKTERSQGEDGLRPLHSYRSKGLVWETPFSTSSDVTNKNPLDQLRSSKEFYKKLDVAIVGGRQLDNGRSSESSTTTRSVELFWEISVVWPTFWAPHILLSGSSTLDIQSDDGLIVRQVDRLSMDDETTSSSSLLSVLGKQISPRFWDWYHIGMTPSAEQMPRMTPKNKPSGGLFAKYGVYDLPGRLMTVPTLIETGTRDNRNAEVIPDHSFACYIKTMGPSKQEYVPTTPIEVRIGRESAGRTRGRGNRNDEDEDDDVAAKESGNRLQLSWSIPLSVEFQARNELLPLPGENPEAVEGSDPQCSYRWEPPRRVATIPYGGNVQDTEITDLRKQLYDQVTKDGWKPKLDENGRPQFFFWQNNVKACYTEEGLGMCVYEWRPAFVKSNEVGIELDFDDVQALTKKSNSAHTK